MRCELCGREGEGKFFEFHHFFPVKTRRKSEEGITTCLQCGDQIHLEISTQDLQRYYHNLDRLKERLSKYIEWIQDKPLESKFSVAKKKRKIG